MFNNRLTGQGWGRGRALIGSICWFLYWKYSYYDQFESTNNECDWKQRWQMCLIIISCKLVQASRHEFQQTTHLKRTLSNRVGWNWKVVKKKKTNKPTYTIKWQRLSYWLQTNNQLYACYLQKLNSNIKTKQGKAWKKYSILSLFKRKLEWVTMLK
jgi:hypothetical protein